ncbi:MAG: RAMP superfamily CRISPR-associated protein [Chloroflexota bacterium]
MKLDYFIWLQKCDSLENTAMPWALAGGFADHASKCFLEAEVKRLGAESASDKETSKQAEREKNQLRQEYINKNKVFQKFPEDLNTFLDINFSFLSFFSWLAFQVDFELLTPWYSKDDRVFHLLDNPVRKDRVFGVPFMAASSWKGMLRWACRMQAGLREHLEQRNGKLDDWQDPDWILHLFGNEKGEGEEFSRGALVFYPTWFNRIGFEVINPHSRERRAGTQPIYYEVVPPGTKGTLSLLYAPWPGMKPAANRAEALPKLLEAIETLLTTYGISAKRTVGWGTAKIEKWCTFHKTRGTVEKNTRDELLQEVQKWLTPGGTP